MWRVQRHRLINQTGRLALIVYLAENCGVIMTERDDNEERNAETTSSVLENRITEGKTNEAFGQRISIAPHSGLHLSSLN